MLHLKWKTAMDPDCDPYFRMTYLSFDEELTRLNPDPSEGFKFEGEKMDGKK